MTHKQLLRNFVLLKHAQIYNGLRSAGRRIPAVFSRMFVMT